VDSGKLASGHASQLGLESVWGHGPASSPRTLRARGWTRQHQNTRFWGTYLAVSYVLTGEHRPYDKKVAYARRLLPQSKWGAWELVGRYSHVDVSDRLVDGGIFDRETVGINWWATRRWKIGFHYGDIALDRFGVKGVTHALHTRFQWIY
jgi:phosphate-selective porin OprO/OprP